MDIAKEEHREESGLGVIGGEVGISFAVEIAGIIIYRERVIKTGEETIPIIHNRNRSASRHDILIEDSTHRKNDLSRQYNIPHPSVYNIAKTILDCLQRAHF